MSLYIVIINPLFILRDINSLSFCFLLTIYPCYLSPFYPVCTSPNLPQFGIEQFPLFTLLNPA